MAIIVHKGLDRGRSKLLVGFGIDPVQVPPRLGSVGTRRQRQRIGQGGEMNRLVGKDAGAEHTLQGGKVPLGEPKIQ